VNREDYATDDKCQLSSVSLAASGFLGPGVRTLFFFIFRHLWMMTGAAQPRSDSPCTSSMVMCLSVMFESDVVCIVSSASDVTVRPELSDFLCSLVATGAAPYPAKHTAAFRFLLSTNCR